MSTEQDPHLPTAPAKAVPTRKTLRYEIEWRYTPIDFFPVTVKERQLDCDLTIDAGTVLARIPAHIFEASPNYQRDIHRWLEGRFNGQGFRSAKTFELASGGLTEYQHDGGRIVYATGFCSGKATVTAEYQLLDGVGNILFDSVTERMRFRAEEEKKKTELLRHDTILDNQLESAVQEYYQKEVRPHESFVASLLESYRNACNHLENELVYLYEVREALFTHFKGKTGTMRQVLGITGREWSDFGQLANGEPIEQGRHRGQFPGALRAATEEELVEARMFAKKLLLSFLQHLGNR